MNRLFRYCFESNRRFKKGSWLPYYHIPERPCNTARRVRFENKQSYDAYYRDWFGKVVFLKPKQGPNRVYPIYANRGKRSRLIVAIPLNKRSLVPIPKHRLRK